MVPLLAPNKTQETIYTVQKVPQIIIKNHALLLKYRELFIHMWKKLKILF